MLAARAAWRCTGQGAVRFAASTGAGQVRGAATVHRAFGAAFAVLASSRLVLVVRVLLLVDLPESLGFFNERLLILFV